MIPGIVTPRSVGLIASDGLLMESSVARRVPRGSILFTLRVASALALLLPPLRFRLMLTQDPRRAFQLVRQCAASVLHLSGCRVRLTHADRVPDAEPVMFVANHVSLADAAVLLAVLPFDFRFVANHVFAKYPVLGAAIQAASAHIVDRGSWRSRADTGRAMLDALIGGGSLLVFPEGTTSPKGLLPFRSGAFRAAARTRRPVVPVAIRGTRELFPPRSYTLSNVPVEVAILPALTARDDSREGIADLRDRAASSLREQLCGIGPPEPR